MWKLTQTGQFKKDLKKISKDRKKLVALEKVLDELSETGEVSSRYKPHPLIGNYKGALERHIGNDFLLIWIDEEEQVSKTV